jgi:hypothetical protein
LVRAEGERIGEGEGEADGVTHGRDGSQLGNP